MTRRDWMLVIGYISVFVIAVNAAQAILGGRGGL